MYAACIVNGVGIHACIFCMSKHARKHTRMCENTETLLYQSHGESSSPAHKQTRVYTWKK